MSVARTVISFSLSPDSIEAAIKQVNAYKRDFEKNCERLRKLVAERIAWSAASGFSTALTSDIFAGGSPPPNNVSVRVEHMDRVSVVFAEGEQAVFIEFGAGVYYNGSAGSSPHPWGTEHGYLIGEYGKGYGKKNVWALPEELWTEMGKNGKMRPALTRGTPAAMPMYRGMRDAIRVINSLAQEVFG